MDTGPSGEVSGRTPPVAASGVRIPVAAPPPPVTLEDTGLSAGFLQDLLLKILYSMGAQKGHQLSDTVCLPGSIVDEQLHVLQQRQMVEVRGTAGHGRSGFLFDLAAAGRTRAQEALAASRYVGPAPVTLEQYRRCQEAYGIGKVRVSRTAIEEGFRGIVLDAAMVERLGPAINSARSLFLHGESGNGKTLIAESIARMLGGSMFVPYAVSVEGQVMLVHDLIHHGESTEPEAKQATGFTIWREADHDRRFAHVRRPVVVAGGELTLADLDLRYDAQSHVYQAPIQVKANGGVLIIDDFGRQRVPPRDLLNRWIVPLERRYDFLTLGTGGKFSVPFDCLLIFATNLDPRNLVEEAFLRRIRYKIRVPDPSRADYEEIFRGCCGHCGVEYLPDGVRYIYEEFYGRRSIPARSCHPRDILEQLLDVARFLDVPPVMNEDLLGRVCRSYFLQLDSLAGGSRSPPPGSATAARRLGLDEPEGVAPGARRQETPVATRRSPT